MTSSMAQRLALILVVAFALRLGAGVALDWRLGGRFAFGDSDSYWTLARTIAEGKPYECGPTGAQIFRTPGYPLLLAPLFLAGGGDVPVIWGRVLSAVLGTLAVGGVWWLGTQVFDARVGLIAAALAAVYPGAIATSALVLSEAPFCPWMLANLALWVAAWRASTGRLTAALAAASGAAAGAAALVRPSWLLFLPFALLAGMVLAGQRKRQLSIALGALVGLVLVMTPWWIRNARVCGHFVPTALQMGASLYDGLNPQATGASDMAFVSRFVQSEPRQAGESAAAYEYRLDRRMRAEAIGWAEGHPGQAVRLAGVKLTRMWNLWPNEAALSAWPMRLAVAATYVPVLLLALVGIPRTIRGGLPYLLCWLPAMYFTLLHVIFVGSIRYRQPAMLALMVLAAAVVARHGPFGRRQESPLTGLAC